MSGTVDISVGVVKPDAGETTIINENNVGLEDRVVSLENAQGIKTGATAKVFVIWKKTGYEYTETFPVYYINGQAFPAGEKGITLEAAHATLDRIDTFGLSASGAFAITGAPALEPIAPTVNSANEIFVTTVLVKANTVEPEADPNPTPVADVVVYKENVEWQTSAELVSTNFNHTGKPFEGTKAIRVLSILKFKDTVNVYNKENFEALYLKILSSYQGSGYASFSFQFFLDELAVSSVENIRVGLDFLTSSTAYSTVLIDLNRFAFTSNDFNIIKITPIKAAKFTGASLIDNVILIAKSIHVVGSPSTDTSFFVRKDSFHFNPIDTTGVINDLDISTKEGSGFTFTGTVTELHSLYNSNMIPKYFYGQDFYIKNDQATPFLIKHNSGVIEQERYVFLFPNEEDLEIQPKEIFHFKAIMTEYNGGTLEFVGVVTYKKEEIDILFNGKADRILSLKPITGTTYNVIADDSLVELVYDGTDPMNVIIPNNATVPFPVGTVFYSVSTNTGALSVSGGAGVTFQTAVGLTAGQNEVRKYTKRAANVWGIEGSVVSSADMILSAIQTISGLKTYLAGKFGWRNVANTFTSFFTNTNTASRTYTLQDRNGTLADLTDVNAKMANPTGGIANYLPKFLTATTMGLSRLWDTGSKLGIGTTKTPTEDITFGRQDNRTIGVENSPNTVSGKSLTTSAGSTVNYAEGAGFQAIFSGLSGDFKGAVIEPISQDLYVVSSNGTSGVRKKSSTGSFILESAGGDPAFYRGLGFDNIGNIYLAIATGGYRKKTIATGLWSFIAQPAGITGTPTYVKGNSLGDLYYATSAGLWKQTGGTGSFVLVYTGYADTIEISPIDDSIYLFDNTEAKIKKQTAGTGSFDIVASIALARGLCCANDGNVYAAFNTVLHRQLAGTGAFVSMGISVPGSGWVTGLAADNLSSMYAVQNSGTDVFYLDNNAPGTPDLDGGTKSERAGTGKGTGRSRWDVWTGQKTPSGTNMQALTKRIEVDELGALKLLTTHQYADNATAIAAGLEVGSMYWTATGELRIVI